MTFDNVVVRSIVIVGTCLRCGCALNEHESDTCQKCDNEMIAESEAEEHRQDMIHYEIYGE